MSHPTVSVIIPAHNAARTIRKAIDSALRQTLSPLEVIVVDDASCDDTAAIVGAYGNPVKVIGNAANRGPGACRYIGLDFAQGEWVTFVDADDWLSRTAVARSVEAAAEADIVQMRYLYRSPWLNIPFEWKQRYEASRALDAVTYDELAFPTQCWGKLYRKEFVDAVADRLDYEGKWGEDVLFNLPLMLASPRIVVADKAVYNYRWGGGSRRGDKSHLEAPIREVTRIKTRYLADRRALTPELQSKIDDELSRHLQYLNR